MKTIQQIKSELDALLAEKAQCEATIAAAELSENRLRSLGRGYHSRGEIEGKRIELRDAGFPVFETRTPWANCEEHTRIIAVTEKWITLREDGRDEATDYSSETGRKKGTRDTGWRTPIDTKKALAIWAGHIIENP